jgi:hypothetical protein
MADTTNMMNGIEGAVTQTAATVQKAASSAVDKAHQMALSAGHKAEEVTSTAGKMVDEATAALGERLKSMAGTIRAKGLRDGMLGNASGAMADTLDSAGRYLQEEGLAGMEEDVTELIRRNPTPAVLIGVGIGFLLAKVIWR